MRFLATILLAAAFAAQAHEPVPQSAPTATAEYLLDSAASDLRTHAPFPTRIRDVRLGYVVEEDGKSHYRLCGQYLSTKGPNADEWVPFVTLKTSGYEQYLGGGSRQWCESDRIVWEEGEWTSALQSRMDAIR